MKQLQEYIISNYKVCNSSVSNSYIKNLMQLQPKLYKQIQVDVYRGMWRFKPLFKFNQYEMCQTLQQLFEQHFMTVFVNLPREYQQQYYQGLTDIFEVVFIAFMNKEVFEYNRILNQNKQIDTEHLFKYPNVVLNHQLQLGVKLQAKFAPNFCVQVAQKVITYLQQFDPIVNAILDNVPSDIKIHMLTKFTLNCCVHETNLPHLSFTLAQFFLEQSDLTQAFLIQSLISISSRLYLPYYFDPVDPDPLFTVKSHFAPIDIAEPNNNYLDIAMQIVNGSLNSIIRNQINEEKLVVFVNYLRGNVEKCRNRKGIKVFD
ncbi:Conserved_hypothetical protein [Hexamita inflata]|uniref:Uncharacterized protein n=1 Tax=Hexamita inflata TaxID=28002 RepID=A0AA86UL67_9EUKA|nr:Conserved hypothetical protein [Hexamita inflata]